MLGAIDFLIALDRFCMVAGAKLIGQLMSRHFLGKLGLKSEILLIGLYQTSRLGLKLRLLCIGGVIDKTERELSLSFFFNS